MSNRSARRHEPASTAPDPDERAYLQTIVQPATPDSEESATLPFGLGRLGRKIARVRERHEMRRRLHELEERRHILVDAELRAYEALRHTLWTAEPEAAPQCEAAERLALIEARAAALEAARDAERERIAAAEAQATAALERWQREARPLADDRARAEGAAGDARETYESSAEELAAALADARSSLREAGGALLEAAEAADAGAGIDACWRRAAATAARLSPALLETLEAESARLIRHDTAKERADEATGLATAARAALEEHEALRRTLEERHAAERSAASSDVARVEAELDGLDHERRPLFGPLGRAVALRDAAPPGASAPHAEARAARRDRKHADREIASLRVGLADR